MKPLVIFYTSLLSATGGGQYAMTLLAEQLAGRGYRLAFLTRPPLRRDHRYVRRLSHLGIPVRSMPHLDKLLLTRIACLLGAIPLCLVYAMARRRSLGASWIAAKSIILTRVARLERHCILRELDRWLVEAEKDGRSLILHIWGPAALTPLLLEWAQASSVAAIYHEMGEADEKYIETWGLRGTVQCINHVQEVICCSSLIARNVRSVYGYTGPVRTIPFMIRDPKPQHQPPNGNGKVTFGAIGRLVPHKRHSDLLHAVKRLRDYGKDVRLVIAGDGPLLGALKELAAELGIAERVSFTGEFEDLSEVMSGLDVFCLTSSSESQCMPVTESMAYGKPVVASDFGGIPDFVEQGVTGYLVPVGDRDRLVAALKQLVESPELRREMGASGRARFLQRYTQAEVTAAIESVYRSAVESRPAAGLRLAYVVESYGSFIVDEIRELRRLGAAVTVLNAFRPAPEREPTKEILRSESLYFPSRYRGVVAANFACALRRPLAYFRMARLGMRERVGLRMLGLAGYCAREVKRRRISHLHGTFGTRTTTLAHMAARLAGIDYSFTTHAYDVFNPNPSLVWKTNSARFMRTISEFNRRFILENYAGIDASKVKVCYLGVDVDRFAPSGGVTQSPVAPSEKEPRGFRIISVGSLIHQKGHSYLIKACGELRERGIDFTCEIIGEGPAREWLEGEIEALGLSPRVRLVGLLSGDEVREKLAAADAFALACVDMRGRGEHVDGIPVALMEAMAMGLPVVSTRISGIPELIEDSLCGILVSPEDHCMLADALARVWGDHRLAQQLGAEARDRAAARFNLTKNTTELARLFGCNRVESPLGAPEKP